MNGREAGRRAGELRDGGAGGGPHDVAAPGSADLPALPGFREMAQRRHRLVTDLAQARRAVGLTQTEVAARMRTSQSMVARLEAGDVDVRLSTLERYAEAVGRRLDWHLADGGSDAVS